MTKTRQEITIGDAVEIKGVIHDKGRTVESWRPATVTAIDFAQIGVAFADSQRMAIPLHRSDLWRPAGDPVPERGVQTKWGFFPEEALQAMKIEHDKAKEAGSDQFTYQGAPWNTGFVGYLLQYARDEGCDV